LVSAGRWIILQKSEDSESIDKDGEKLGILKTLVNTNLYVV